jgi:isopentenyl-diphosphate Delta-isomerase
VLAALRASPSLLGRVLASGGIRTGMDVAKCLALGARAAGLALPLARAVAREGADGALAYLESLGRSLRRVMLLTGSRDVEALRRGKAWIDPWLAQAARELVAAEEER